VVTQMAHFHKAASDDVGKKAGTAIVHRVVILISAVDQQQHFRSLAPELTVHISAFSLLSREPLIPKSPRAKFLVSRLWPTPFVSDFRFRGEP
jgi:hypothetical protein